MQRKEGDVAGADPAQMRLQIYPRRKAGQKHKDSRTGTAVVVTLEVLHGFAEIPLVHAAKKLGISKTALKSACRTLGLERWPFRRPPEEPKPKPKSESAGRKRGSAGSVRGGGGEEENDGGRAKGRKKQKVSATSVSKAALGKLGKHAHHEKEIVIEEELEEQQLFEEECGHDEGVESGFDEMDSCHDLDDHVSKDPGDAFDHQHGAAMEDDMHEECRQRDEDWGSGTEEGTEGTSSTGADGTSEKTSGDESGSRSSGDDEAPAGAEGCHAEQVLPPIAPALAGRDAPWAAA